MTESLYPSLSEREPKIITAAELDELTGGKLSKARANEIINKQKELEKDLRHYKKLRKKYKKTSNILRGLGIGIGSALAVGGAVAGGLATGGIAVPILVPTVLAGVGAIETTITNTIAFTYIKKKIHRFSEKYDLINTYLNRLYHLYHRSVEDAKITLEEMDEFHKLIREYENEMSKMNSKDSGGDLHINKLEHLAEVEAKKEYEAELLIKLKNDKKQELEKLFRK